MFSNKNVKSKMKSLMSIKLEELSHYIYRNRIQIGIFLIFLLIYGLTIYPDMGGRRIYGDSCKWQFLHLVDGTPHPTGYPFFLVLTKLFHWLISFLKDPYAITGISVFFGSLTLVNVYNISLILTKYRIGGLFATILLGTSYTFWVTSTEAEVYALNAFFVSLVTLFMLKYSDSKKVEHLLAGCAIYALSFGNHLSMICLLPAMIYLVWRTDKTVFTNFRVVLLIIIIIILGASQYGYIYYLSHKVRPDIFAVTPFLESIGEKASLEMFLYYITAKEWGGYFFSQSINELFYNKIPLFLSDINFQFNIVGMVMAIAGFVLFFTNAFRHQFYFLFLILLCQLLFALNLDLNSGPLEVYFLPAILVLSVFYAYCLKELKLRTNSVLAVTIGIITVIINLYFNVLTPDHVRPDKRILIRSNKPLNDLKVLSQGVPEGYPILAGDNRNYQDLMLFNYLNVTKALGVFPFTCNFDQIKKEKRFYFTPQHMEKVTESKRFRVKPINKPVPLHEFLRQNQQNIILISVLDEATMALFSSEENMYIFNEMSSQINELGFRGSYIGIAIDGKMIFEKMDSHNPIEIKQKLLLDNISEEYKKILTQKQVYLYSSGYSEDMRSHIMIDNIDHSENKRGLNIVILNHQLDVLERVNCDTFKTTMIYPKLYMAESISVSIDNLLN